MGSGSREAGFQKDSWEIKVDANPKLGIRKDEDEPNGKMVLLQILHVFFFANFLGRFAAAEWGLVQLQVQQQQWDNCAGLARVQTPPPAPAALSF